MVASKPLPPIPPVSEKVAERVAEKLDKTDKRASHAFPSLSSLSSLSTLANLNLNLNLRRRNDAPSVLTDSKASTPAHSRPSTPQPPSSTGTTTTTIAAAQPGDVASALVATPTVVKHGLVLDHRSLQHLRAIARQSISSSCLEPEILWLRLFMDMIQRLSVNVSDAWQQIEASYESTSERISAEQDTSLDGHADDAPENNNNNKKKKNIKEPLIVAVAAATSTATAPVMDHKDQASRNTPSFSYSIQLVKRVSSSQECTFTPGRFEGESILLEERSVTDRKRHNKKEEPIQIQLGGTVSLSAGAEDLPKAEKILELLVFALCSLQLEMYLLKDHHVVRQDPGIVSDSTLKPLAQQNPLTNSKRASKGSMFFGWLSRGTLPAKYKKGTTQLTQDPDTTPTNSRHGQGAYAGDDLSFGEDHNNHSYRFAKIIQHIEKAIISVSPDIVFPPPHLLLRLRDEEAVGPDSKRKSYTWEDVEFVARKIGFGSRMNRTNTNTGPGTMARTYTASIVSNKSNRLPIDSRAGIEHFMTNSNALQGIFNHQSLTFLYSYYWSATAAAPCNPPKLITVEYYRKEGYYEDMGLGEMIEYICKRANSSCLDKTCGHKRLEHISTYTHGEGRINITLEQPRPDSTTDFDSAEFAPFLKNKKTIAVWTRCKMCRARTKPTALSRASQLYSFGKYLELLLYAQHFEPGPRLLCDHAVTKDAISRCFLYGGLVVTFEYESIDLFEMRISRLQVNEEFPHMPQYHRYDQDQDTHDISTLFLSPVTPSPRHSAVSMSMNGDYFTEADQISLINATRLDITNFYDSCKKIIVSMEQVLGETKSVSKQKGASKAPSTTLDPAKKAALGRLDELGGRWKEEEFELYDHLKRIPVTRLNDLRNRLRDSIKRTMRSMESWQKEHCPQVLNPNYEGERIEWVLPDYVSSDSLHTFPGSAVIVREEEPSSIIASALSCMDYLRLLSSISDYDQEQEEDVAPVPPKKDISLSGGTIAGTKSLRQSRSAGSDTLNTRKSGSSGSGGSTTADSTNNESQSKDTNDDEDGDDDDDSFLVVDGYQTSVKFLQVSKVDFSSLIPNGTMSPRSTIGLHFGSGRYSKNSTLSTSGAGLDKKGEAVPRPVSMMALPNSTPTFVTSPLATPSTETAVPNPSFFLAPGTPIESPSRSTTPTPGGKSKHTFGYHSLTSGLSGTMKGLSLNALSEKIGSGFSSYGGTSATIDKVDKVDKEFFKPGDRLNETLAYERESESMKSPHLKTRFSHGKTSFSCSIYFAAEFDTLRRRCGIHQDFVQSLARCNVWSANGGKSKSSFYKTKDDRFVVKQMVSSWNIAEKDELLKFAPKYFEYMEQTHEAPTVLAKIFGFYTFKIKNGTSGQIMKIDVLVMEHLFYNQKITRTFDLKGIQDRHAGSKPNTTGGGSTTLWDGDFIEGRYKALLLIYSHSKKIIRESLLNDTEFLAGANIMDYSLLVGVDDERKELVVGIVDFIGAYTWAKRIESKGKTTLRGAKDNVTVLPPQQYKARFREAMEKYFLAIPDKWSKTVIEQSREVKKELSKIPSTIPEGSKESTDTTLSVDTPDLEETLKNRTSGYLEKMSKVIMSTKSLTTSTIVDGGTLTAVTPSAAVTPAIQERHRQEKQQRKRMSDQDVHAQKLPRVFYPLD
ncbi:hypothetical protein MVEG_04119 [Podila verticillata NRRL 6337]|nr:hypothetical protein MVEG_04119 [Podila verticillata NRRL 6337]